MAVVKRHAISRWAIVFGILLALVISLLFWAAAPALFYRLVGWFGVGLMILSVVAMVLTCRRAKRVTASSQVVPILVSLVTVMIYAALLRAPVGTGALAGFALLGTLVGVGWGLTGRFFQSGVDIRATGTAWHLLIWGSVFVVNQCVLMASGRGPSAMLLLLFLSMGLVWGRSGVMLARYYRFRAGLRSAPPVLS